VSDASAWKAELRKKKAPGVVTPSAVLLSNNSNCFWRYLLWCTHVPVAALDVIAYGELPFALSPMHQELVNVTLPTGRFQYEVSVPVKVNVSPCSGGTGYRG
jgi:hypothetical protein